MKSTYIAAAALLSVLSSATPTPQMGGSRQGYQGPYFAITGAVGGVQPRLELRDLQQSKEMWNLYLLAMTDFQAMEQNGIASYYQVAGIHGMPWTAWDGVEGSASDDKSSAQKGYCPHNQLLFGTWHRPYLALFEQVLQSTAMKIADTFSDADRAAYQDAAIKLRTPYWDWAASIPADEPVLPTALTDENVDVLFPNGTGATIHNPLYDYRFHPLDNTQINGTGCPTSMGNPDVCQNSLMTIRNGEKVSNHPDLDTKVRKQLRSQRSKLFTILSQWQSFDAFSNAGYCGGQNRVGTLEELHNALHNNNWPGHMSPASVSAFDPLFWLHHANVDRQMALYQALYPDTYVNPCKAETPTYTISKGDMLDENTPLKPFHRTAGGEFWTSATSRNITGMGYTYPELLDNPSNATLIASVKAQYSGPADVLVTQETWQNARTNGLPKDPIKRGVTPKTKHTYLVEAKLPLFGLDDGSEGGSPYNLLVFLGNVSSDPKEWLRSDEFAGMASVLGGRNMRENDQSMLSTIDISENLEEQIAAGHTTEDTALEFLQKNLHWRLELGEREIPRNSVKGIEVNLVGTDVEVADAVDAFDHRVGEFKEHGRILS